MEDKLEMLQCEVLRVMNGMEYEERAQMLKELIAWCQNEETEALKMANFDSERETGYVQHFCDD